MNISIEASLSMNPIYSFEDSRVSFDGVDPQFIQCDSNRLVIKMWSHRPFFIVRSKEGIVFITEREWGTGETLAKYLPKNGRS
jgi:hypothetical protein